MYDKININPIKVIFLLNSQALPSCIKATVPYDKCVTFSKDHAVTLTFVGLCPMSIS